MVCVYVKLTELLAWKIFPSPVEKADSLETTQQTWTTGEFGPCL